MAAAVPCNLSASSQWHAGSAMRSLPVVVPPPGIADKNHTTDNIDQLQLQRGARRHWQASDTTERDGTDHSRCLATERASCHGPVKSEGQRAWLTTHV